MPFTQHTRSCRFPNATGQISTQKKKIKVPMVAYLRGLHECRAILSNSCASTHPAPVVLCPPNNFCPTRLLLREKMSHPIFAQHLRLEVERCFNESENR